MSRKKKSLRNSLRSLKKPTKLDEITKAVPKPKGAIPNFGLPRWKILPLDSKLPLIPAPKDAYHFSRNKIGQKLFIGSKNAEFNLNDPYNHEIDFSYDPLHDEYLAEYFSKKNMTKVMINRGFITKDLDAICSVKEYNMYRGYLKKIHGDSIKKELNLRAQLREDRRVLERAEREAAKDFSRIRHREERIATRNDIFKETLRHEAEKQERQKRRIAEAEERINKINLKKKQHLQEMILRSKIHTENVERKRAMNVAKARQKIINVLLNRAKKERIRKKTRRERVTREEEHKRKIIEQQWQKRGEFQKKQIARESTVMNYAQEVRKRFIENYKRKVNKERRRIKDNVKKSSQFRKCYAVRHKSGPRKRTCCKIEQTTSPSKNKKSKNSVGSLASNKKLKESINSQSKNEILADNLCLMTEKCKCDDPENEFCEDHEYF